MPQGPFTRFTFVSGLEIKNINWQNDGPLSQNFDNTTKLTLLPQHLVKPLHTSQGMSSWQSRYNSAKLPDLNPFDACRGFPTELTPQGQPCCIVGILGECSGFLIIFIAYNVGLGQAISKLSIHWKLHLCRGEWPFIWDCRMNLIPQSLPWHNFWSCKQTLWPILLK